MKLKANERVAKKQTLLDEENFPITRDRRVRIEQLEWKYEGARAHGASLHRRISTA